MQTNTKIYIGLGLAAAIAAYFVFRPKNKKSSPIITSSGTLGGGKPKPIPSNPKPLPFEIQSCPDGERLVAKRCVPARRMPDKDYLLQQYQDYSYKPPTQFYDSGIVSTILK